MFFYYKENFQPMTVTWIEEFSFNDDKWTDKYIASLCNWEKKKLILL